MPCGLLEGLRYDRIGEIFDRGLHGYLAELLESCLAIGQNIASIYFYYGAMA
jgi:uncharacterized alpha-E superfamily protein